MDTGSESPPSVEEFIKPSVKNNRTTNDVLRLQNPINSGTDFLDIETVIQNGNENSERFTKYRDIRQESEELNETKHRMSLDDTSILNNAILNDSVTVEMSKLTIDESIEYVSSKVTANTLNKSEFIVKPSKLETPAKKSSFTHVSDHPLMQYEYPDIIPERRRKAEDDADQKQNVSENFSPQRNTSKSNLYAPDNLVENLDFCKTPDVAMVKSRKMKDECLEKRSEVIRRKIVACFTENRSNSVKNEGTPTSVLGRPIDYSTPTLERNLDKYVRARNKRTSKRDGETESDAGCDACDTINIPEIASDSGRADWAKPSSMLCSQLNIQPPIDPSSPDFEDAESSTTVSRDESLYQARVSPATGLVVMSHAPHRQTARRLIAVQPQDTEDRLSFSSDSVDSLHSEEADLMPEVDHQDLVVSTTEIAKESVSSDGGSRRSESESSDRIAEYSRSEENERERAFKKIPQPDGSSVLCDMKVIEPFMRVLSHGGYAPSGAHVIVFSACFLPHRTRTDYTYVIDNLLLYVLWTLDRLVTDDYELVYLHSGRRPPPLAWLVQSYRLVDTRLRKSLKHLYLVHPTFWLKTIVYMTKPFISSKFSKKLSYVHSLAELYKRVAVDPTAIPESVVDYDTSRQR